MLRVTQSKVVQVHGASFSIGVTMTTRWANPVSFLMGLLVVS